MANTRTLNRSFSGGELSPEMYGRIDDVKYQAGAALLKNFIATPQGPAENRPGFAYVNTTKASAIARLIPFAFSVDQTMVVELGQGYIRLHTQGETLEYDATQRAFVLPITNASGGPLAISVASPCVVTWPSHGLQDGDLVSFDAGNLP